MNFKNLMFICYFLIIFYFKSSSFAYSSCSFCFFFCLVFLVYQLLLFLKTNTFSQNRYRHRGPEEWWSYNATIEDWFDEMVGQANILNRFSKIRMEDIRGLRVPFLRIGWNRQFLMMKEFGFVYDSSMVAPFSNPPLWPYTLDHKIPHPCVGK